ncbi:MAG: exonuclease [Gordonia amarae]
MGKLAAIDIETTGLNAEADMILEVGVVVFDEALSPTAAGVALVATTAAVNWALRTALSHPGDRDPAQSMHMRNGLITDLLAVGHDGDARHFTPADADAYTAVDTLADADAWVSDFLAAQGITHPVPMVGSSVRSLDAPFLQRHMPRTGSAFTHRTIDASALLELARFTDPGGYAELASTGGTSTHRTIGDCHRSLGLIRAFTDRYGVRDVVRS